MAIAVTIEAVRVTGADGTHTEHVWDPRTWYLVSDDYPFIDILTRGHPAQAKDNTKLQVLSEISDDGVRWQRWDFEAELARQRRLGEISLPLKAPKNCTLRCYIIPTSLLSYRDVIAMVEDIEAELGGVVAWDLLNERPDRSWSRHAGGVRERSPSETIRLVEEELRAALSIRRNPFSELGPPSKLDSPLPENSLISHWAARRSGQLCELAERIRTVLKPLRRQSRRKNPDGRQEKIEIQVKQMDSTLDQVVELRSLLARQTSASELGTPIYPSPLFQRDHRLRLLLRVFSPPSSEALSEFESPRSHYPPVFLNHLWELWGAVWLARTFRRLGFSGFCHTGGSEISKRCSWRLWRDEIVLELDFEPEPVLVDYSLLPPPHERDVPALEWAARNQELDGEFPFIGLEPRCSPDYLLRLTTPSKRFLLVGDASLASPKHHGKRTDKTDAKPHVVERYRRTIGWSVDDRVVRCGPMGGFVVFPAPSEAWAKFEKLPGASDCVLLCPSPRDDVDASARLEKLLVSMAPDLRRTGLVDTPSMDG